MKLDKKDRWIKKNDQKSFLWCEGCKYFNKFEDRVK